MISNASRLSNDEGESAMGLQRNIEPYKLLLSDSAGERDAAQIMADSVISVIEERSFIRECIARSLQLAFSFRVLTHSNVKEFIQDGAKKKPRIILFSCSDFDRGSCAKDLDELLDADTNAPVIVLGPKSQFLNVAISHGAKGYIPLTTEFEVVVGAVRVVLAGGTYVPMDCLPNQVSREQRSKSSTTLTTRELSVARAIQTGKSNKAIAYILNMTESTVKVHVKHIMTKLNAKNRTEVAMISEKFT